MHGNKPVPGTRYLGNRAIRSSTLHPRSASSVAKHASNDFIPVSRVLSPPLQPASQGIILSDDEDNDFLLKAMDNTVTSTPDNNRQSTSQIDKSRTSNSYVSFLTSQEKLELRSWGLPESVLKQYQQMGIEIMFPWQAECLCNEKVLNGGNLVYSAPTSAGKTLVAEILMLKRVFEQKKKAILIYPFVSLAREKMLALKKILRDTPHRVGGFMGSHHPPGGFKTVDVAVCTIEKANSLLNRMLEDKTIETLGCVVVDELHLLGDSSRGYLLELLLTKIQFNAKKSQNFEVQIIGMSATLPNLGLLASWLSADLYQTNFRPVPLSEHIKINNKVYDPAFKLVREIVPTVKINNDPDHLVYLSLETLLDGYSVLIFTPTKNWAEKLAENISKEIHALGMPPNPGAQEPLARADLRQKLRCQLDRSQLSEVLEQLRRSPASLDPALDKTIRFGVAYHHAGLTLDERDIVETAFKHGILRILVATSTLSSGVNLPARRVIVRSPFTFANQMLDTLTYRQMIGRAGRKGIDTEGESILLCKEQDRKRVEELVTSNLKPVTSCLIQGNGETLCSSMKRAILEVIVSGLANTPDLVEKYAACTLLSASIEQESSPQSSMTKENSIQSCVKFLDENEFIRLQTSGDELRYAATQLGLACLGSSLSPDEGLTVLRELEKARKCFVLENDLHIIYQVIPVYLSSQWPNMDWMNYLSLWESLSPDMKRVGELVGVEERFLVRAMRGTVNPSLPTQSRQLSVHNRFYIALALHDLVNEVSLVSVSQKYGASKGMLQSLQQTASTYAGMVTVFCSKLGWHSLELLIGQFQDRLQFGIQRELIDLCRLTSLNSQRARLFFNSGIESVAQLANSLPADIENLLANSAPFESCKQGDDENKKDANKRKQLRTFFVTGKKGLTESEAAALIVEEARDLLQSDLGILVNWEDKNSISFQVSASLLSTSKASTSKQSYSGRYAGKAKKNTSRTKKNNSRTKKKPTTKRKAKVEPNANASKAIGPNFSRSVLSNKSFDVSAQIEELFEVEAQQVQAVTPPKVNENVQNYANENLRTNGVTQSKVQNVKDSAIEDKLDVKITFSKQIVTNVQRSNVGEDSSADSDTTKSTVSKSHENFASKITTKSTIQVSKSNENLASKTANVKSTVEIVFAKAAENEEVRKSDVESKETKSSRNSEQSDQNVNQVKAVSPNPDKTSNSKQTSDAEVFKTPILKLTNSAGRQKSDPKRRVSWNDQNLIDPSPPKKAKKFDKVPFDEKAFDDNNDLFCDTSIDLANMSLGENAKPNNQINKSCPKTPGFDACSEELLLESTDDALTADQLLDVLHDSFKNDNSISDSFLERAITTHMSEEEPSPTTKTENKNNDAILSDNSDLLFQTPPSLKEQNSVRKRIRTQAERTKLAAQIVVATPSPKRSQRLQQRRQQQKALLKQHSMISPGIVLSSDSENDCNTPNVKKPVAIPDELNIIDVCSNKAIFEHFSQEWSKKESYAIALGCSKYIPVNQTATGSGIGLRSARKKSKSEPVTDCGIISSEFGVTVIGLAVSWDKLNAFFISLSNSKLDPDDTIAPPTQDLTISISDRLNLIRQNIEGKANKSRTVIAYDLKLLFKVLYMSTGILMDNDSSIPNLFDPKVGAWMLQTNDTEKNLHNMVMTYTPQLSGLLATLGSATGCGSVALNPSGGRNSSPRARAVAEVVLAKHLMDKLKTELEATNMWKPFKDVEMPALVSLIKMELNGFGFNEDECERQRKIISARLEELEEEAYKLAGRQFSLTSYEDTSQVLYRELRLPLNGEKSRIGQRAPTISKGSKAKGPNAPSSSKDVLIKLMEYHKLPKVILEWRKLNSTITKVVGPMKRQMIHHPVLNMNRIYSTCVTFTSTGRVSLNDPNIQNIPKEFDIEVTPELLEKALGKDERDLLALSNNSILMTSFASLVLDTTVQDNYSVSLRKAFVPSSGCFIIAADYSQLELRIIAHLSGDVQLIQLLTETNSDVFKSIAATWKRKPVSDVTEKERGEAKQICYGMLYGMGIKALSEQLCVVEEEAAMFLSTFKSAYPGVKKFMDETIVECRKRGYVVTLGGRRRYLPNINQTDGGFAKAAAERQAINSTVQGSAADLVKEAMVQIEKQLTQVFPTCKKPIRYRPSDQTPYCHSGAYFLLQLHDELIFEVVQEDVVGVTQIIRDGMERAVTLRVPTPVRIKVGMSWGELQDVKKVEN